MDLIVKAAVYSLCAQACIGAAGLAVGRVADEGVTDVRHMDADLVGAPGGELALDQRGAGEALDDPVTGQGLAPAWNDGQGHFTHLPLVKKLADLGYKHIELKNVEAKDLLYYREGQVVARELLVLEKL